MNPIVVFLFAMVFVSLMLAVVLVTAWNSFGRPAHALTWSVAFAIAAVGWAVQILMVVRSPVPAMQFTVGVLAMATWATLLLGFRQRAGQRTCRWRAAAIIVLSVVALSVASMSEHRGLMSGIPLLFAAAMLTLSAVTMMFRAGSPAERAVITMLLAFAMLDGVATVSALVFGTTTVAGKVDLFRAMILLTLPSAFVGTGLFAVFLLAADLADRMGKLAACDPLTSILNRRGFDEAAGRAIAQAHRQGRPLSIVIADLDRFKAINDRHGHAVGDAVLCRFAEHVAGSIRRGDLFGRIGGEEFAILLVDATPAAAAEAVERIRAGLARLEVPSQNGPIRVTASFGMTGPSAPDETLQSMLARADEALYQAKLAGRDRVILLPPPRAILVPPVKELVA